jgi:hypothetical protein
MNDVFNKPGTRAAIAAQDPEYGRDDPKTSTLAEGLNASG